MSERNKAIVVNDAGDVEIVECEKPQVGPHEVLLQMKSASLCTMEQRSYKGIVNYGNPFIGGHEACGVAVEVGDYVYNVKVGDKVVPMLSYCQQCDYCKLGKGTQCENLFKGKKRVPYEGNVFGGGLARYMVIPAYQACSIDERIPFDQAALIEPLSCCIHSVVAANIQFGETVVIIGAGIMGILQTQLCRMKGSRVIVSEPDPSRREFAFNMKANHVLDPSSTGIVDEVKQLTNGRGADVVINTTASHKVWDDAVELLSPFGRLIAYSSQHPNIPSPVNFGKLHSKEFKIIGAVSPNPSDYLMASRLLSYGLIELNSVIAHRFSFEKAKEAFSKAVVPGTYRVVILHDDEN
ncbi:MAG: zinc-dependent alcohol dehydrogenase [Anaerolineaceae bacterium]|jgi:L-iditol 2-dehydrogenase